MAAIDLWHSKLIHRAKIAVTVFLFLIISGNAGAQSLNKPFYDYSRWIHFGFTLGTNYSRFKYDFSPEWYKRDTFIKVSSKGYPGLTLGAIANVHLGEPTSFIREHFDLRFIPTLVLTQRRIVYTLRDSEEVNQDVESAMIETPLLLKFKSDRLYNIRFYVVGGFKYGRDLASDYKARRNPTTPKVIVSPNNYCWELGTGLDLYFPYFKFSPEVKISRSLNNVLLPDEAPYSSIFSRFRSNFIFFSMHFEG